MRWRDAIQIHSTVFRILVALAMGTLVLHGSFLFLWLTSVALMRSSASQIVIQQVCLTITVLLAVIAPPVVFGYTSPPGELRRWFVWFRFCRAYFLLVSPIGLIAVLVYRGTSGSILLPHSTFLLVFPLLGILFIPDIFVYQRQRFPPGFLARARWVRRQPLSGWPALALSAGAFGVALVITTGTIGLVVPDIQRIEAAVGVPERAVMIALLALILAMPYAVARVLYGFLTWKLVDADDPHCTTCGYNLTGNVSGICPECGTAIPSDWMIRLADEPGRGAA